MKENTLHQIRVTQRDADGFEAVIERRERLAYRVPVRVLVDVDFPVASVDDLASTTHDALRDAARSAVIDLLPTAIAVRCVVDTPRLKGEGLRDTARIDGGAAHIELPVPK